MLRAGLFLLFFIVMATPSTAQNSTASRDGWKLTWAEEFGYDGLPDSTIWRYEQGYVRNNEAQEYMKGRLENTRVEDGMLVIEARKEPRAKGNFTSGSITTEGKKYFHYGRIEVRAKIPTGTGTWPAIWMLGRTYRQAGWPACGEIDIMENVGYEPSIIHANIHTRAFNHRSNTGKGNRIEASEPWADFHTYALEWNEQKMDFYYDDVKYFTYENSGKGVDEWPFDEPQFLILNVAIGGAWGGQKGIDETGYPKLMLVDYVRVYQPAD